MMGVGTEPLKLEITKKSKEYYNDTMRTHM